MTFSANLTPTFPKQPQTNRVQIAPADTTTQKTVYTAGSNGSKIVSIIATSTDTSARNITVSITNGGTSYPLGTIAVAITAGTVAGTPAVNLLDSTVIVGIPFDSDGNPFLYLISGDTLTVNSGTTVTTAKAITVHAIASDF